MQWCFSASDLDDGRKWLFERRVSAEEIKKKTKEYQYFVFNKIFPEKNLKKCISRVKNIIQKKSVIKVGETSAWDKNSRFYTDEKKFYYFLKEINYIKEDIKGEYNLKNKTA